MHNVSSVLWRRTLENIYITSKVIWQALTSHFVFNLYSADQWAVSLSGDKCRFKLIQMQRRKTPEPLLGLSRMAGAAKCAPAQTDLLKKKAGKCMCNQKYCPKKR